MNDLTIQTAASTPNYQAIKGVQKQIWGSGDYAKIGTTLQITGEHLCEAMDLRAGQSVLDVAAGNGNATMAAARRFCRVVSTDYLQEMLDKSRARVAANGLAVDYRLADAEQLPFDGAVFDNVLSTFGVMFAPNQDRCASELLRVCRTGGKIGLANWTPHGFIGRLFKLIGSYVTPPAGVQSPALWGTPEFIEEHFSSATDIQMSSRHFVFRYQSARHWLDVFSAFYGPIHTVMGKLEGAQRSALERDIVDLIDTLNVAEDGTMVVPSEYLEIVITK